MEYKHRERIIEIIEEHAKTTNADKIETNTLLTHMRMVNVSGRSISLESKIINHINDICNSIGYVNNEQNNLSRKAELIVRRDVVSKLVYDEFRGYDKLTHVLGEQFGKDRTTGNNMIIRSVKRFEYPDDMFTYYYEMATKNEEQ